MAMSDCEVCWETPCACGSDYTKISMKRLKDLTETLQWVHDTRAASPLGRDDSVRRLSKEERDAFAKNYPDLRVPHSLNQLTQEQLTFIAGASWVRAPTTHPGS